MGLLLMLIESRRAVNKAGRDLLRKEITGNEKQKKANAAENVVRLD